MSRFASNYAEGIVLKDQNRYGCKDGIPCKHKFVSLTFDCKRCGSDKPKRCVWSYVVYSPEEN